MATAILQQSGRTGEALLMSQQQIYLALGRGIPDWDVNVPPAPSSLAGLVDEIGRIKVTQVAFVQPSPAGEIELEGASSIERYTASAVPTRWLHLRFALSFADAQGETIREAAIYFGTVPKATVPAGQRWLAPADIDKPGWMKLYERRGGDKPPAPKIVRVPGDRPTFEYVIEY